MRKLLFFAFISTIFCVAQNVDCQTNPSEDAVQSPSVLANAAGSSDLAASGLFAASVPATGVSGETVSAVSSAEPGGIAPVGPHVPTTAKKTVLETTGWKSKRWLALTAMQHGSAVFDAWSTRQALSSGNGYERDPFIRPFARSATIYPALQVLPLGLDYLSSHMMHSQNTMVRKLWWVPQTVSTVGFVWNGARNLHVATIR